MTRNEAEEILKEHGQEHVLRHFDDLSAEAQEGLSDPDLRVNGTIARRCAGKGAGRRDFSAQCRGY